VTSLKQNSSHLRRRTAAAIGCSLAAAVLATSWMASAQDQSAATAKDVIFARKTMMSAISDNMDQIETMIASGKKIDLDEGHEHADTMSVMFMAFPHLFPPSSNQWKPNADLDPGTDTFASPDAWSKFSDFYQRAAGASKTAFDMSRADKEDEFKARAKELRVACDACHAIYLKTQ
jgi:cytochrome c556